MIRVWRSFAWPMRNPFNGSGKDGSSENVKCPMEVKPADGIGPIHLNQSREDLEALGMAIKYVNNSNKNVIVGRTSVGFDGGNKVRLIEVEIGDLPTCLYYGKTKISPRWPLKKLAKLFLNCGELQRAIGGNAVQCEGITIGEGGWGGRQKTRSLKILR